MATSTIPRTLQVANNLTTTNAGYVLDARQGKVLNDDLKYYLIGINITVPALFFGYGLSETTVRFYLYFEKVLSSSALYVVNFSIYSTSGGQYRIYTADGTVKASNSITIGTQFKNSNTNETAYTVTQSGSHNLFFDISGFSGLTSGALYRTTAAGAKQIKLVDKTNWAAVT